MITIRVNHDWCHASWEHDPAELITLQEACSYKVADRYWQPSFRQGFWDGKRNLFRKHRNQNAGYFPSGIVQIVVEKLHNQRVHLVEERVYTDHRPHIDPETLTFDPRSYQLEAICTLLEARRGILQAPTASGKTKIMVGVIALLNLPTLWITHEGALGRQARKEIELGTCTEVGFYAGGKDKEIKRWTVGLVQSLHRRRSELKWWFDQIKVVVLDECHHGTARSWYATVMDIPAPFRFGCSATPFERSDKSVLELIGATGPLAHACEVEEVKEHLSRPRVEMIDIRTPYVNVSGSAGGNGYRNRNREAKRWRLIYKEGIVENDQRNQLVINRAMQSIKEASQCIVFVSDISHGYHLSDMLLSEAGTDSFHAFIYGKTPQPVRDELYSRLRSGDLRVLIASDRVAGEGQDIPSVRRIVIAGGMKSPILVKQRVGRGMRPGTGEAVDGWGGEVLVHDFLDNQHLKLLQHSNARRRHYEKVGAIVEVTHG